MQELKQQHHIIKAITTTTTTTNPLAIAGALSITSSMHMGKVYNHIILLDSNGLPLGERTLQHFMMADGIKNNGILPLETNRTNMIFLFVNALAFKYFTKNFSNSFQKRQSENYFEEYLNLCLKLIDSDTFIWAWESPAQPTGMLCVYHETAAIILQATKGSTNKRKPSFESYKQKIARIKDGQTDEQKPVSEQAEPTIKPSQQQQRTSLQYE
uniref:Uncharacterized protein n=1 Tax=Glossina pallidipes TaxID=7398 RepID=A0A1B0AHI8_GLOPL